MLSWTPDISVNVGPLDDQHRTLFRLIDYLGENIEENKVERLDLTIDELVNYALYHFISEERLLASFDYPDLEEHKAEHQIFAAQVKEFRNRLTGDKKELPSEIYLFLLNWLKRHIQETDKKYGPFLNEKGIY